MNEEQRIHAERIRAAINRVTEDLRCCNSVRGREELVRHLARLHDIEYAILTMVKFDAATQEEEP